jgi:site-specific DNA recombinase
MTSRSERARQRAAWRARREQALATLRNLLHNPLLGGRIRAGDSVVRAAHDAILNEPTWEALQAKLARPEKLTPRHRRVKTSALLANLLRCAKCGASMSSHWTGKENGRRHHAYVCQSIIRRGAKACPGSRAPAGQMEAAVVERIMAIGRDPALVAEALAAAKTELAARAPALTKELAALNEERRRLTGERKNIVDAIAADGGAPALTQKLADLDAALEQVATRLHETKAQRAALKGVAIDEAELRAAFESFRPVWDALFPKERARILNLLIDVVRVNVPTGDVEIVFRPEGVRLLAHEEPEVTT